MIGGQRRQQTGTDIVKFRMSLCRGHDEHHSRQAKNRDAVFNDAERAAPEKQPDKKRYWDCPVKELNSGE